MSRPDIDAITKRWRQTTEPHRWYKDWNVKQTFRNGMPLDDHAYALGPKTTPLKAEKDAEFLFHVHGDIKDLVGYIAYLERNR